MRITTRLLITVFLLLTCSSAAVAWNRPGHMVTGAIAYYELKAHDPSALTRVISLLKRNPYYQTEWLPRINALQDNDPDKHDLYLFMYAARWPDDVRGTNLHCEKCHYINFPFRPPGQPASVIEQPPAPENILKAYSRFRKGVENGTSAQRRAIALSWVFHLVGDIHQPLHTSTIFTVVFPNGDRGGTHFYIRPQEDSKTQHLHSFWDGLIITTQRFSSIRKRARDLLARGDLERSVFTELSEISFNRWGRSESLLLAKQDGYLFGHLEGSADEEDGEVLPDGYADRARAVAERRVVLAGYRLADILAQMF